MKSLIQRVSEAAVRVDGRLVSVIGKGMLILYCVEKGDTVQDMELLVKKISNLRIFNDENGVMNLSVKDTGGELLVVSQFTLAASTRKGNRPSYINAAGPDEAVPMYERFCARLEEETGTEVRRGIFGADMKVSLINDGPVTIMLDAQCATGRSLS